MSEHDRQSEYEREKADWEDRCEERDMHMTARELLYSLRGVPAKCDFCDKEVSHEQLEPEEGGLWYCRECFDRWEKEDAAETSVDDTTGE